MRSRRKPGSGCASSIIKRCWKTRPGVPWLEVHTENYMGGGPSTRTLEAIRRDTPISLHGVGLSLGSADGLDPAHLERVRQVAERIEPALMSEHVAWSVAGGDYLADLLPLPMTEEALDVVCRHVTQTQDYLKRRILVENPSTYVQFSHSTVPEWEFMATVAARTGCGILCDVNNIYVSAKITAGRPRAISPGCRARRSVRFISRATPCARSSDGRTLRIDDHGSRVSPAVWALYEEAIRRFGPVPTLIEWDNEVPTLAVLQDEAAHAQRILDRMPREARHADAA